MGAVEFSTLNFATWSEIVFKFTPSIAVLISALVFAVMMGVLGGLFPALAQGATVAEPAGVRPDLTGVDTTAKDFLQQAAIPMASETHTGDDVAIYAWGPYAHLFHGTVEQNIIYHVMSYAMSPAAQRASAQ